MSRNKINEGVTKPMGKRLNELVTQHLELTWVEFAAKLNYTNSSTLHKARIGATTMTAEKLHDIAMLTLPQGKVNLHWLITGEGDPFLQVAEKENVANMKTKDMFLSDEGALITALINILQRANQPLAKSLETN